MPTAKKKGYSARDLRDVSDNPEWTKEDFAKAKPFAEVFPELAASIRKGRGPNKAPTKKLVSLRLSGQVIEAYKAKGPGWQSRIDADLRRINKIKWRATTFPRVVPAKAGTHNALSAALSGTAIHVTPNRGATGLWVPAFAGTTR